MKRVDRRVFLASGAACAFSLAVMLFTGVARDWPVLRAAALLSSSAATAVCLTLALTPVKLR